MECRAIFLYTFVIITCSLVAEASNPRHSRCQEQTSVSLETNMNHTIPRHCKKGRMTWHYPQGSLLLHFHPRNPHNRTIWVCVQNDLAAVGMSISDMTGGTETGLPRIRQGFAICVPTVDNGVDFKWFALSESRYMAAIAFTVVKVPR